MSNLTRVPVNTQKFNEYIIATDNLLQADDPDNAGHKMWERLGLTAEEADAWHTQRQAWGQLYPKFLDPAQKTKVVNEDVTDFKKDFSKAAEPILNKISGSSKATNTDSATFRVVLAGKRKKATHRITPITEECIVGIVSLGSTRYKFSFRKSNDTKRPSLPPGVKAVQVAVQMGGTQPESADELMQTYVITKATSIHEFGTINIGKKLYLFARWYDPTNPDFAGSWSEIHIIPIV